VTTEATRQPAPDDPEVEAALQRVSSALLSILARLEEREREQLDVVKTTAPQGVAMKSR
jgi:predicted RecB family endonuclease